MASALLLLLEKLENPVFLVRASRNVTGRACVLRLQLKNQKISKNAETTACNCSKCSNIPNFLGWGDGRSTPLPNYGCNCKNR
jgi:hypothetical protein